MGKGFGFIQATNVPADVYFKDPGGDHPPGSQVAFYLKIMPDGKLQAQNVSAGLSPGETYTGTVSSYSNKNGYGFITVPDCPGDVYFKKDVVEFALQDSELRGKHARVVVQLTRDGKPQASSVQMMDHPPPGYHPPTGLQGTAAKRIPPAVGIPFAVMNQPLKKMRPSPMGMWDMTGNMQATGMVSSYNPTKGFGFITSPNVTNDVFFGRGALPPGLVHEHLQGRSVCFQLTLSPQGKQQAQNLQVLNNS